MGKAFFTEASLPKEIGLPQHNDLVNRLFKVAGHSYLPQNYVESYQQLLAWIERIIDTYRDELYQILPPVFMHIYVHLIKRDMPKDAKAFFSDFYAPLYFGNLSELRTADTKTKLKKEGVSALIETKWTVSLTSYAYSLLINFLEAKELFNIISIMNMHVSVVISETPQRLLPALMLQDNTVVSKKLPLQLDEFPPSKDWKVPLPAQAVSALQEAMRVERQLLDVTAPTCVAHMIVYQTPLCIDVSDKIVAAGFENSVIYYWDLQNERHDGLLVGNSSAVYSLAFLSSGKGGSQLLSGNEDGEIRLWDLNARQTIAIFSQHQYPVWSLAVSPFGHYFASGSLDKTARVWSVTTSTALRVLVGHLSDITVVRFFLNTFYLLTGSEDKTIRIWDLSTGNCVRIFNQHRARIADIYVTRDAAYTADACGVVCCWDIDSCEQAWSTDLETEVTSLAASFDGRSVVCGTVGGKVYFLNGSEAGRAAPGIPTKALAILKAAYTPGNLAIVVGMKVV